MAVLPGTYADDQEIWDFAKLRHPGTFTGDSPNEAFRAAIALAADEISGLDPDFYGQPTIDPESPGQNGVVWPRSPREDNVDDERFVNSFLDGVRIPGGVKAAQLWWAIVASTDPSTFGDTSGTSSFEIRTQGGLRSVSFEGFEASYHAASDRTGMTTRASERVGRHETLQSSFGYQRGLAALRPYLAVNTGDVNVPVVRV